MVQDKYSKYLVGKCDAGDREVKNYQNVHRMGMNPALYRPRPAAKEADRCR